MRYVRYAVAGLVATVVALGVTNVASAQDLAGTPWDYAAVQRGIDAQLSHPDRWRFKTVADLARSTIVEGRKRRTGSRRYFVVSRHLSGPLCQTPGTCATPDPVLRLRIDRVRGPINTVVAVAVALDDAQ